MIYFVCHKKTYSKEIGESIIFLVLQDFVLVILSFKLESPTLPVIFSALRASAALPLMRCVYE